MLHKRGYKEPLDFGKAIEPETIAARRRDNWDIFYDYISCGLYYAQVKAYLEELPQVKVILYEDLAGEPGKALREICEFLSVDFREDVKLERLNKSGIPKFGLLNELINKSSLFKNLLMAVIPESVRKRMKHKAYKVNMKQVGMSRSIGNFYIRSTPGISRTFPGFLRETSPYGIKSEHYQLRSRRAARSSR